jgi:hypothetical protein
MNEWAARIMSVLPERLNNGFANKQGSDNFDLFVQEV